MSTSTSRLHARSESCDAGNNINSPVTIMAGGGGGGGESGAGSPHAGTDHHLQNISSEDHQQHNPEDSFDHKKDLVAGMRDKSCWTMFAGACFLGSGLIALFIYSLWESPASGAAVPMHSFEYFMLCMFGGVLSGLPHTILTPVDLIKCRVQCGEYTSLGEGISSLWHEGKSAKLGLPRTLLLYLRGWAPTFIGYSIQGSLKFGLYELFKYIFAFHVFSYDTVMRHKVFLFLFSSACAETFADIGLAPWEAVKVKIQTTRTYPPVLAVVVPRMFFTEGFAAFFKGLPALWGRQIPYTMMKFASFEKTVELLYVYVVQAPKSEVGHGTQLMVSMVAGVVAGALCCIVSHPADTLVSKLNQRSNSAATSSAETASVPSGVSENATVALIKELGCRGLWKGIGARLVMISSITAMQWLIYDSFKVAVGLPTTGGGGGGKVAAVVTAAPMASGFLTSAPVPSGMPK